MSMMGLVRYHVCRGLENWGPAGSYDYYFAGNGVWLRAENDFISASIQLADIPLRGLELFGAGLHFEHGKIPRRLFDLALSVFINRFEKELYIAMIWDGREYHLVIPDQEAGAAGVKYTVPENVVLEMHSHPGRLPVAFSSIDDGDEQGFKIFGVIGDLLEDKPCLNLRLGIYGHFQPLRWQDVFEGELDGAIDVVAMEEQDVREVPAAPRRGWWGRFVRPWGEA